MGFEERFRRINKKLVDKGIVALTNEGLSEMSDQELLEEAVNDQRTPRRQLLAMNKFSERQQARRRARRTTGTT